MSAKTRKTNLVEHLMHAILTQELLPGAELDEAALCKTFELSRTPVREVFRDLEGLGYVQSRENRGVRVSEMSHTTLRDFFLAAPMIYGAILRLAAQNATAAQIDALKASQADFCTALAGGNPTDRTLANHRFHQITGEMAGNIYLLPSFHRLLIDHARIGITFYRPTGDAGAETLTLARQHHDAIIKAIENRDEAAAAGLAEDHWALSRDQIESFVMPASLDLPLGRDLRAQSQA